MPRMTQAYPFEWKVLSFAQNLSARLVGTDTAGFLMVLDDRGAVRTLQFGTPEGGWHHDRERLESAGTAYLFYDPFDAPEYTWLSWHKLGRTTMERLLEQVFEDADFRKRQSAPSRTPDLETEDPYPESWGVMF